MTRIIALLALCLSVVACVAVPAYMQRQTQAAIDRALRQREAQLVERYKPLLHELGDWYMAAAEFENAQTVDQMVDALVRIVRAAAEAERQAKLEQGGDGEVMPTNELAPEPAVEGTSRLVNHEQGSTVSMGGRSKRERSGAVLEDSMDFEVEGEVRSERLEGQIAYVATKGDGSKVGDGSDIYLVNADGSQTRQLTRTRAVELSVALSFDGSKVAWVSELDGRRDIFVSGLGRDEPVNVTEDLELSSFEPTVAWLPNGEQLAFTVTTDGKSVIQLINVSTREVTPFLDDAEFPSWSPDGSRVAFSRGMRLMIADANGTGVMTPGSSESTQGMYMYRPVRWLPDSRSFVFTSLSDQSLGPDRDRERMFSMYLWNTDEQRAEKLTRTALPEVPLGCSPDGEHLLFLASEGKAWGLYLIRIDGRSMGRRPFHEARSGTIGASWSVKPAEIAQR
jgi:hypothetical protein